MNRIILIIIFFTLPFCLTAQNLHLVIEGSDTRETAIIDSLSYKKIHSNARSVATEITATAAALVQGGYLETELQEQLKTDDSTFRAVFRLGRQTVGIHIYTGRLTGDDRALLNITADTLKLKPAAVEPFMTTAAATLEKKGYSLSVLQLRDYMRKGSILEANLYLSMENKRTVDGLVLQGYDKFPQGIQRNILKQYKGKTFNRDNLEQIYKDFNNLRFISQTRYPEILFKKDTTTLYVYVEKAKANAFDGFIGFTNDDTGGITFTGYLDLSLNNVVNTGERVNLYWKSDGKEQTTFNASAELPYIFKSPVGVKALLRIFKQDSTFQNTVTDINVGYYSSYNSRVFVGRQQTQSVDIQNLNSSTLSDFNNSFWTASYEYTNYSADNFLFPERTTFFLRGGTGERQTKLSEAKQYFAQLNLSHNIFLNTKNLINFRTHNYYLNSNGYVVNELFRFGGISSIRGFNENSLQASLLSSILAEYRYILTPALYVHSITDFGYFQDKSSQIKGNLLGLGLGIGLLTNNGRFNILYANGSTENQRIKLSNSIVHLSFKSAF